MNEPRKGVANLRREARKTTLKSGRIIYNNATCLAECRIENLTERGAGLRLADLIDLPDAFTLELLGGPKRTCKVRWRRGVRVGVEFE